jgi:hypothetical protein
MYRRPSRGRLSSFRKRRRHPFRHGRTGTSAWQVLTGYQHLGFPPAVTIARPMNGTRSGPDQRSFPCGSAWPLSPQKITRLFS